MEKQEDQESICPKCKNKLPSPVARVCPKCWYYLSDKEYGNQIYK